MCLLSICIKCDPSGTFVSSTHRPVQLLKLNVVNTCLKGEHEQSASRISDVVFIYLFYFGVVV